MKRVEITCRHCGTDALLVREPRYDGLKKTGETLKCGSCGHRFASEDDVQFKEARAARVFDESDASRKIAIFSDNEKGRLCRYCVNYVVNPYIQRCDLHKKLVEATDTCDRFKSKPAGPSDAPVKTQSFKASKLQDLLG